MARVKTFANGGSLLPGDFNAIQDDYEFGFSTYRTLFDKGLITSGVQMASGSTYALQERFNAGPQLISASEGPTGTFHFDPADYSGAPRGTKYRLRVVLFTNATAPTSTFTVGLYPITAVAGGAGVVTQTQGAVNGSSVVPFAAPAASTQFQANSGDFAAPAAGYYCLGCAVTVASQVANSAVMIRAQLQLRQV